MKPDPVIDRVRAARHAISERCGHDPKKLVDYYLQRQETLRGRLVRPRSETVADTKACARHRTCNPPDVAGIIRHRG